MFMVIRKVCKGLLLISLCFVCFLIEYMYCSVSIGKIISYNSLYFRDKLLLFKNIN